jgi:hypothetical protein
VPSASAPGSGSGRSWSSPDTGTPGDPAAQEESAAPAAGSGDEDDDWPTRYSWLDDEPDQTDESVESVETGTAGKADQGRDKGGKAPAEAEATVAASVVGPAAKSEPPVPPSAKARDAETATQATPDEEPADAETRDAAAGEPAETDATVIAFRSRKEPESEEPGPAGDADEETDPADESTEGEAEARTETDAEAAARPEDEPPAAAPTADAMAADATALVAVVRGVPRYHEPDCVLIRFMPEGDLQKLTVPQAKEDGCTPCAACQPAG